MKLNTSIIIFSFIYLVNFTREVKVPIPSVLSNKEIKSDIEKLSARVDEHNNYGIKIPVIEKELESVKRRLINLEEK